MSADAVTLPAPSFVMAHADEWTATRLAGWGVPWPPPAGWRADLTVRWNRALEDDPASLAFLGWSRGQHVYACQDCRRTAYGAMGSLRCRHCAIIARDQFDAARAP